MFHLSIAVGGALGSMARAWLATVVVCIAGPAFPWGTIAINIIGSSAIGFFGTLTTNDSRFAVPADVRAFVVIGICGGFATFSSFSLQTLDLARDGSVEIEKSLEGRRIGAASLAPSAYSGGRISTVGGTGEAPECVAVWWVGRREITNARTSAPPPTRIPRATTAAMITLSMKTAISIPIDFSKGTGGPGWPPSFQ